MKIKKDTTFVVINNNNKYNFKSFIMSNKVGAESLYYWCNPFALSLVRSRKPKFFSEIYNFKSWCRKTNKIIIYKNTTTLLLQILFCSDFWLRLIKLRNIKNVDALLEFKIDGIVYGPMIYDTILRHHELNTIDIFDRKFKWNIFNFLIEYFAILIVSKNFNLKNIIAPDITYTNNGGVQGRFGLSKKLRVILTSSNDFYTEASNTLLIAARNYFNYHHKITVNDSLMNEFKNFKINKFNSSNSKDVTLSYMKVSAYHSGLKDIVITPNSVIIFLHDFFDAFHYTNIEIFKDYYSWIREILDFIVTSDSNRTYYFKLHPNSNKRCMQEAVKLLTEVRDGRIKIIDAETNNQSIFKSRPELVVSLRGNVLFEAAIHGIKCLGGNDSPYVNYNFVKSAQSKDDFIKYLLGHLNFETKIIEDELISFYCHHYSLYDNRSKAEELLQDFSHLNFDVDYFKKTKGLEQVIKNLV
jgi:hypothetical protein